MRLALIMLVSLFALPVKAVTTLEAPSCMEYVMNFGGNLDSAKNKKWLLGFLSGMAYSSGRDGLKNKQDFTIYHLVYDYCKSNEDVSLDEAADAIFIRMTREVGGADWHFPALLNGSGRAPSYSRSTINVVENAEAVVRG